VKNLYQLTPKGIDLMPTLIEIILWGDKYFDVPERVHRIARDICRDKRRMARKISKQLAGNMESVDETIPGR
jgi:DNA-binding HxlR family transcriptional regulator